MEIRKVTEKTLREDFLAVMNFVNYGITNNLFPYTPRRTLINEKEIDDLWIPSIRKNTSYHVFDKNKIIASGTVFSIPLSTSYEHANQRPLSSLAIIVDPKLDNPQTPIKLILEQLISEEIAFTDLIPKEDFLSLRTYRSFGFKEKIEYSKNYHDIGLSGNCVRFTKDKKNN